MKIMPGNVGNELIWEQNIIYVISDNCGCFFRGREFRPHYLSAGDIQSLFPCSTVLTLTATCDTEMRDELTKLLHLRVAETDFVMEFPDRCDYIIYYIKVISSKKTHVVFIK